MYGLFFLHVVCLIDLIESFMQADSKAERIRHIICGVCYLLHLISGIWYLIYQVGGGVYWT